LISWGRAASAALVAAALTLCRYAYADGSIVRVVRPDKRDELAYEATRRLEAELRAAGFSVVEVERKSSDDPRASVEANPKDGFAAIAIVTTDKGAVADVWVADRVTQKTVVRRIDVARSSSATAPSDLAVRSVELLRASLLEVWTADKKASLPTDVARFLDLAAPSQAPSPTPPLQPAPIVPIPAPSPSILRPEVGAAPPPSVSASRPQTETPIEPPARAQRPAESTSNPPYLEAGAAFGLLFTDSFHTSARPVVTLGLSLPRSFFARALVAPPLASASLYGVGGRIDVTQWSLGAEAGAMLLPQYRISPVAEVGGGVYHVALASHADEPYVSRDISGNSGYFSVGLGVRANLTPRFGLGLDVRALFLEPAASATILGAEVGRSGHVLLLPTIGVFARFF
jgi:hypothetical protein